ncbi:MAG: hypothetical protein NVSMB29_11690 [Candidatus Dormibacteria bacterium]
MPVQPPSRDELGRLFDPEATLPSEDPDTPYLEDAQHWIAVYGELLGLKKALLDRADEVLRGASDDAIKEAGIDERLLRAQAARYEVRRTYWVRRAETLLSLGYRRRSGSEVS